MKFKVAFAALGLAMAGPVAFAQSRTAIAILGIVEKIDTTSLTVRNDAGGAVETVSFAPNLLVLQIKSATLADIRSNDFVASAAVLGPDGKLHSTELRIFPEAMRGVGEGQRPMNDARNQTMTNATVTGAVIANGSNTITVKFGNGSEAELILDPGVPVTRIDAADKALVKTGVKVRVQGTRDATGTIASRITLQ